MGRHLFSIKFLIAVQKNRIKNDKFNYKLLDKKIGANN